MHLYYFMLLICISLLNLSCLSEGDGVEAILKNRKQSQERGAYPSMPYGKAVGSTIENLSFISADMSEFHLKDIYDQPKTKLLLLTTSAEWCTACIKEQPKLQDLYDQYQPRGLDVLVTLFQDANFEPATDVIAKRWKEKYDLSFHVVADTTNPSAMSAYYDIALTPMVMLVDVNTMQIIYLKQGFDIDEVSNLIETYLPQTQSINDRQNYPPEPYGVTQGSVIKSVSFVDTDDQPFALKQLRENEQNQLLLLTTSAEWCTACIKEQPQLQDFYDQYQQYGLTVLVTLFQDANFVAATSLVAKRWKEKYDLSFDVVADTTEPSAMSAYYDIALTPMIMLIDLNTMEILYLAQGFDQDLVTSLIKVNLGL
jgi:peroxiredoxin